MLAQNSEVRDLNARVRVAVAQTNPVLGDVAANVADAHGLIAQARGDGADIIVFPELALTGYSIGSVDADLSLEADDDMLLGLAARAGEGGLLIGFVEGGERLHSYNAAAYYENGQLIHVHRKLYLPTYRIFEERKNFSPGQTMRAYPTRSARMATLICNDAWQPQLGFLAVQDGARILSIPTNSAQSLFPQHYDAETYWFDILRFVARMFQCYVVFANRVGVEDQLRFWGGSSVVDPWGEVVGSAARDEEDLLVVDVFPDRVRQRRRQVPLVKEARLGLLQREIRRLTEEGGDL